jgi:hypothetical protein
MGLARLVRRNRGTSVVLLGAVVSLGVVAVSASRFSWRRTKSEPDPETTPAPSAQENEAPQPRWDTPPTALEPPHVEASGNPPSP